MLVVTLRALFVISVLRVGVAAQDTVNVLLYYETLCPYSIDFVVNQLQPTNAVLGDYLHIRLVPYGKATQTLVNQTWTFECQHGPDECYGNKLQVCVLEDPSIEKRDQLAFVFCLMADWTPAQAGQRCAEKCGLTWANIEQCAGSNVGGTLLAKYGDVTRAAKPPVKGVPMIKINGIYSDELDKKARTNLRALVCETLKQKPSICT